MNIDHFPFKGGLNLVTPPLNMQPGELLDCSNIECLINGGYGRVAGYSLFDGQTVPSQAVPGSGSVKGVHIYKGEVFAVREDGTNGRLYKASATGWQEVTLPSLWSTGGSYRFANYNFYGQDSQEEMFAVNAIDNTVKFDGTTAVEITQVASSVIGYASKLALGKESSVFLSKTGDPTNFNGVDGAVEIAVSDSITDFYRAPSALIIGCKDSTQVLYGKTDADFSRDTLNSSGVYSRTIAEIAGDMMSLDQQGVFSLAASKNYGNFGYSAVSQKIQPKFPGFMSGAYDPIATVNRAKSQYRLFSGTQGIYFTFSGTKLVGIGQADFAHPVLCLAHGEDTNGNEITVFGSDDGNVYLMDSANNFAGQNIRDFQVLAFNYLNSPTTHKRFRSINVDARAYGDSPTIYFKPVVNFGAPGVATSAVSSTPSGSSGGSMWDFARWDQFYWDSQYFSEIQARLSARGRNMALTISSDGAADGYYELYGATLHYSPRRLQR